MTMTSENPADKSEGAFWLNHPDPTQAAVHLALQWLAHVYPASELQIESTLSACLPYADSDLSSRAAQFFDQASIEDHVTALEWVASTLTAEQMPFLVETAWRLLLIDHELPAHVPLALRILGQVLTIAEAEMLEIGKVVFQELTEQETPRDRAPLLPLEPRYLDRIEWRLHGEASEVRPNPSRNPNRHNKHGTLLLGFLMGAIFGAVVSAALIFGPLKLGRIKVPIVLYQQAETELGLGSQDSVEPVTVLASEAADPAMGGIVIEMPTPNLAADATSEPASEQLEITAAETPEPQTAETSEAERVQMQVTASLLNVRESASGEASILITLSEGDRVWAYPGSKKGVWIMVEIDDETGFASARYLEPLSP